MGMSEEFGVAEVMTAVAGEIEADEAVDHVERAGAQVDVVVQRAQALELGQHPGNFQGRHEGLAGVGLAPVDVAQIGVEKLFLDVHAVAQRVVEQPQGHLTGGEMQLGVKHAVPQEQYLDTRQHFVYVLVKFVRHARLIEQELAHRRVTAYLQPSRTYFLASHVSDDSGPSRHSELKQHIATRVPQRKKL